MLMMMLIMDDVVVLVRASIATVQICSLHELYFGNSRFWSYN